MKDGLIPARPVASVLTRMYAGQENLENSVIILKLYDFWFNIITISILSGFLKFTLNVFKLQSAWQELKK